MFALRKAYYRLVKRLSEIESDQQLLRLRAVRPPHHRHSREDRRPLSLFSRADRRNRLSSRENRYRQPRRQRGITKNNFYTLYDMAMLGITSHSKVPLRLATLSGFCLAGLSLLVGVGYFVLQAAFLEQFLVGIAPLVIGIFFFSAVQLFFIGILGEYIGAIHTQVLKRPLVTEKERINFDERCNVIIVVQASPCP